MCACATCALPGPGNAQGIFGVDFFRGLFRYFKIRHLTTPGKIRAKNPWTPTRRVSPKSVPKIRPQNPCPKSVPKSLPKIRAKNPSPKSLPKIRAKNPCKKSVQKIRAKKPCKCKKAHPRAFFFLWQGPGRAGGRRQAHLFLPSFCLRVCHLPLRPLCFLLLLVRQWTNRTVLATRSADERDGL